MEDRAQILDGLPASIATTIEPQEVAATSSREPEDLWREFAAKLSSLGGRMAEISEIEALQNETVWTDDDARTLLKGRFPSNPAEIWSAKIGITTADLAVAESGSLLLSAQPGRRRMASLSPEIHVVLIPKDRIVATLEEALAKLPDRTNVLITGTSRTADIESVLVRGVHGPREVWVVVLNPEP